MMSSDKVQPGLNLAMAQLQTELRSIAARQMAGERADHTLQPTALVNEAYLRLFGQHNLQGVSRATFLAAAAQTIRRILVDHARAKRSEKRGGNAVRVTLAGIEPTRPDQELEMLALNDAMTKLQTMDERAAKVVELRYFGGLTVAEVAESLEISERTVADDWTFARAWLRREIGDPR